jgi:hypothetical protein
MGGGDMLDLIACACKVFLVTEGITEAGAGFGP